MTGPWAKNIVSFDLRHGNHRFPIGTVLIGTPKFSRQDAILDGEEAGQQEACKVWVPGVTPRDSIGIHNINLQTCRLPCLRRNPAFFCEACLARLRLFVFLESVRFATQLACMFLEISVRFGFWFGFLISN